MGTLMVKKGGELGFVNHWMLEVAFLLGSFLETFQACGKADLLSHVDADLRQSS
jgi:hypothetical protein